jgi:hypothetical protein
LTPEYRDLRRLLLKFPDFQKGFQSYSTDEQALLAQVSKLHTAADRAWLEAKFPETDIRGHMTEDNAFIFMTPFVEQDHVFLPLLSVDLDYTIPWPLVSINALHYGIPKGRRTVPDVRCFGYRFDKPAVKTGEHDYFHVQFTHGFPKGRRNPKIDSWISTKDPSFPIDATNTVEMFLSAVIGLRNRHMVRRTYFDEWSQAGIPLSGFLAPMAMTRWKPPRQGQCPPV